MSELVNREQLTQKLRALNTTQQSIEGTANWCLFYHREAKTIVSVWDEEFHHTSAADKKIAQLYLANHLLQEGKKKGREFGEEYSKVIYKAIKSLLHVGDEKARKAVERLVGVWDERRVFGSGVIKSLREAIARAKAAPPPSSSSQNGSQAAKAQQPVGSGTKQALQAPSAHPRACAAFPARKPFTSPVPCACCCLAGSGQADRAVDGVCRCQGQVIPALSQGLAAQTCECRQSNSTASCSTGTEQAAATDCAQVCSSARA